MLPRKRTSSTLGPSYTRRFVLILSAEFRAHKVLFPALSMAGYYQNLKKKKKFHGNCKIKKIKKNKKIPFQLIRANSGDEYPACQMFEREGSGVTGARQARKSVPRTRYRAEFLFPLSYEHLSPMLCNEIQFRHASMRAMYVLVFCHIFKIQNARRPEIFFPESSTISTKIQRCLGLIARLYQFLI